MKKISLLLVIILLGCSHAPQATTDVPVPNIELEQALGIRPPEPEASPRVVLETDKGDITLAFYTRHAPRTVENFLKLVGDGFYDGVKFHRIIRDFMIQTGDPNSKDENRLDDGIGGPSYTIADEFNEIPFYQFVVGMAHKGVPGSGGSQFFIVTSEHAEWLDNKYTAFAFVVDGFEVVKNIGSVATSREFPQDYPIENIIIRHARIKK